MSSVMETPASTKPPSVWSGLLSLPELWGAIAIAFMWMAVLFACIDGGDFVSVNGGGTAQTTTVPSGIFVAFFASLATIAVARRAFRRETGASDHSDSGVN
ncbi:MAG: hypothetical protein J2P22_00965 [Nocardioides sp.]|nr:hypothetical protein [Nocardioides sp.]